jgi:predicted DCC family thiol-disulfide oxidoreductase YuxK
MRLARLGSRLVPPAGRKPAELVLFFDGQCGLCNGLVDLALSADREQRFRFSPLQGQLAGRTLAPQQTETPESVIILRDGVILARSDAVLELGRQLGGIWRLAGILRLVPRPVRDLGYDLVARNRYRWFGRQETCRVPTEQERARFIP